jgi:prolipoprotein diacylglyceryltransferase
VPWGVVVPEVDGQLRHPVQLYEATLLGVLGAGLLCRRRLPGVAAWAGLVGYGALRVVTDCLRDPAGSDLFDGLRAPTIAQVCSVAFVAAGLALRRRWQPLRQSLRGG